MDFKQVFCMRQDFGTFDDTHLPTTSPASLPKSPVPAVAPAGKGWLSPGRAQTQRPLCHPPALPPDPRHSKDEIEPKTSSPFECTAPSVPPSPTAPGGFLVCCCILTSCICGTAGECGLQTFLLISWLKKHWFILSRCTTWYLGVSEPIFSDFPLSPNLPNSSIEGKEQKMSFP